MRHNTTIIVTGGSRGIGKSIVLEAASCGYNVCFSYLNNEQAAENVVEQARHYGIEVASVKADISNDDDVSVLFQKAENLGAPLQALVNNAGISGDRKKVEDMSPSEWENIFKINVFGTLLCSQKALKLLSRGGSILNISSQASIFGGNMLTPYAASKASINTITIALAREASQKGIRVNALSPGVIDTDQNSFPDFKKRQEIINSIPLGRFGTAQEVSKAAMWLISDDSSYITGAILPITGGR